MATSVNSTQLHLLWPCQPKARYCVAIQDIPVDQNNGMVSKVDILSNHGSTKLLLKDLIRQVTL